MGVRYSHIGILVGDRIYHSIGNGVTEECFESFKKTHWIPFRKKVVVQCERYALGYLDGHIGIEYSQSQYFGFLVKRFQRFFRNKKSKLICSEFVANFINDCTQQKIFKDTDFLTPREVFEKITVSNF